MLQYQRIGFLGWSACPENVPERPRVARTAVFPGTGLLVGHLRPDLSHYSPPRRAAPRPIRLASRPLTGMAWYPEGYRPGPPAAARTMPHPHRRRRGSKPDRRRRLEWLASCRDGCTEAILLTQRSHRVG